MTMRPVEHNASRVIVVEVALAKIERNPHVPVVAPPCPALLRESSAAAEF